MSTQRVVLVGAGHAHVEVLRRWAERPLPGAELLLVVDRDLSIYSGMVPGLIAGQYDRRELEIDALALAKRAGARVVCEPAARVSTSEARIETGDGTSITYDWASLDIGSTVAGRELPGVAEHALPARPIHRLIEEVDRVLARARALPTGEPFRLCVVGAGAGGVELAFAFESRLRTELGRRPSVTLIDSAGTALAGAPHALIRRISRALERRRISFRGRARVTALEAGRAVLSEGRALESHAVLWVPGPAAHGVLATGDLPLDARGFVRIGPTLQVEGAQRLFAVGDCASLPGMQKAGVYAVRAGPVLAQNLRRALGGETLRRYEPQREFLSLLNLGDGTAAGVKRGFSFEGRWVMALKDRIDRRFMARYPGPAALGGAHA